MTYKIQACLLTPDGKLSRIPDSLGVDCVPLRTKAAAELVCDFLNRREKVPGTIYGFIEEPSLTKAEEFKALYPNILARYRACENSLPGKVNEFGHVVFKFSDGSELIFDIDVTQL